MKDKKYSNKRNLRLFIVLMYQILGFPFQVWMMNDRPKQLHDLLTKLMIFSIFVVFEIVEYLMEYPSKNRRSVKVLFLIRFLIITAAFFYNYLSTGFIDPYLYTFTTLLVFYSYFVFPEKFSIAITVFLTSLTLLFDTNNFLHSDMELYYGLLLIVQRTITILIFYLFAKFWDADRTVSYKK